MNFRSSLPLALCLACLLGTGTASAQQAEAAARPPAEPEGSLGRLFHSSRQRAILDELRQRNARIGHEQEADSIALQGIVRRSGGQSTVWINGRAHHDRAPVAELGERSARVFVGSGKTQELKVGESIRLAPAEQAHP